MPSVVRCIGMLLLMSGVFLSMKYVRWLVNPTQGLVEVAGYHSFQNQQIYVANLLLDIGANPNYLDERHRGFTALMNAAMWDNDDIVSLLLTKGANPSLRVSGEVKADSAYDIACLHGSKNALKVFNAEGIGATRNHTSGVLGKPLSELCKQI